MNGYTNLTELFLRQRDYDEIRNMQFLESAFMALKGFILNNNRSTVIQDYEAFRILLNLISGSNDPTVITQALICLSTLLRMDWKNVVFNVRMNGLGHLVHLIFRISKSQALPPAPDSFTIRLLSSFSKLNEELQVEDGLRMVLLEKISDIMRTTSTLR